MKAASHQHNQSFKNHGTVKTFTAAPALLVLLPGEEGEQDPGWDRAEDTHLLPYNKRGEVSVPLHFQGPDIQQVHFRQFPHPVVRHSGGSE